MLLVKSGGCRRLRIRSVSGDARSRQTAPEKALYLLTPPEMGAFINLTENLLMLLLTLRGGPIVDQRN